MAGNVSGLHIFQADTGPEPLALLDQNYTALTNPLNGLITFSNYYIDSGAAGALVVTVSAPQSVSYADGLLLQVKVAANQTGSGATINVNGLGAKNIVNPDGSTLSPNQLLANEIAQLQFSSSANNFQLVGGSGFSYPKMVVGPPSAGTALTVNSLAGSNGVFVNGADIATEVVNSSAAANRSIINFTQNNVATGFIGSDGSQAIVVGSANGDLIIRAAQGAAAGAIRLVTAAGGGSTQVLVNSSGVVQLPSAVQPMFNASRTGAAQNLPAASTSVLIFNTANSNQGGNYNAATGVFTAPVAGVYLFVAMPVIQNNSAGAALLSMWFSVTAAPAGFQQIVPAGFSINAASQAATYPGSTILVLPAAAIVTITATVTTNALTHGVAGSNQSTFAGYLLG